MGNNSPSCEDENAKLYTRNVTVYAGVFSFV